jgi:parallel beta-helix repeat protein
MNRTRTAIVFAVMCIGVQGVAHAATYYVSRSGNDGYSCGQAQAVATPKQSLNNAVGCLAPGDTLLVRGGNYLESLFDVVPAGTSWTSKVRIAAYPGETVWVVPAAGTYRVLDFSRSEQYIEFDGINLDGSNVTYDSVKINAGSTGNNAHHIRLMNAEVLGPKHTGTGAPTGQTVLVAAGDSTSIGGNEFINLRVHGGMSNDFDQSFYVQSAGNLIERCEIYDFPGNAVQLYNGNGLGATPDNNIVRNNTIHDARLTVSGQRHAGIVGTGAGNNIYNNIVYNIPNNGAAAVGISIYQGSSNTGVYNNTVYNAVVGIIIDGGASGSTVRNNIAYSNGSGNYFDNGGSTTASNNLFVTNPMFVNASGGNFQLQSGSPATDTGAAIAMVTTDIIGTPRPQQSGFDIGAYEYRSSQTTTAPSAPGGVRIVSN